MICVIDTSVLCNLLPVPGRDQNREDALSDFETYTSLRSSILLPLAAILETGNHIAHASGGNVRRDTAEKFRKLIHKTLDGQSPWTPVNLFDNEWLGSWIDEFPSHATQGLGLGDVSIIKEFERQCELHPHREILIWSYDQHLRGYHRQGR